MSHLEQILDTMDCVISEGPMACLFSIAVLEVDGSSNPESIIKLNDFYNSDVLNPIAYKREVIIDGENFYLEGVDVKRESVIPVSIRELYQERMLDLISNIGFPKERIGKKEDHGMGLHFHYYLRKGKRWQKTNALFTFNPEDNSEVSTLYWETHGKYSDVDLSDLSLKKREGIYTRIVDCNLPISKFKMPNKEAVHFYPFIC